MDCDCSLATMPLVHLTVVRSCLFTCRVKASLKKVKTNISLTADAWTSIATGAYLGVTCHFINEDWELTSYNLTTMPLEDRHNAENIATWVEKAAEKFDISMTNVIGVVHVNASNVSLLCKFWEKSMALILSGVLVIHYS